MKKKKIPEDDSLRIKREFEKLRKDDIELAKELRKAGMHIEPLFPEVDPRPWPYPET